VKVALVFVAVLVLAVGASFGVRAGFIGFAAEEHTCGGG
jgi:hypothetical protein